MDLAKSYYNFRDTGMKYLRNKYPNWRTELNALNSNILEVFKHPIWKDLEKLWELDSPNTCNRQCKKNLKHGIKIKKA